MFIFIFWVLLLSIFICAILKSLISAKALLIGIGLANIRILVTGWTAIPHISYTIIYHVHHGRYIFTEPGKCPKYWICETHHLQVFF